MVQFALDMMNNIMLHYDSIMESVKLEGCSSRYSNSMAICRPDQDREWPMIAHQWRGSFVNPMRPDSPHIQERKRTGDPYLKKSWAASVE